MGGEGERTGTSRRGGMTYNPAQLPDLLALKMRKTPSLAVR